MLFDALFFTTILTSRILTLLGLIAVKTQIIQPPVDTRVLLGHTATLQCKVSSDPLVAYQLDWYHDKQ